MLKSCLMKCLFETAHGREVFQETHSGLGTCISTLEPNVRLHPSDCGPARGELHLVWHEQPLGALRRSCSGYGPAERGDVRKCVEAASVLRCKRAGAAGTELETENDLSDDDVGSRARPVSNDLRTRRPLPEGSPAPPALSRYRKRPDLRRQQ